jgi:hypothetical protein
MYDTLSLTLDDESVCSPSHMHYPVQACKQCQAAAAAAAAACGWVYEHIT